MMLRWRSSQVETEIQFTRVRRGILITHRDNVCQMLKLKSSLLACNVREFEHTSSSG